MFLLMMLLLLDIFLINLGSSLSLKHNIEENKTQTTTERLHFDSTWNLEDLTYHSELLQHYNYTTKPVPIKVQKKTELLPNITSDEVFDHYNGQEAKNIQLTSKTPLEFPWTRPTSSEEIDQEELYQLATMPIATNFRNYNKTTLPKCPINFKSYQSVCYFITEPTKFPPKCPYPPYEQFYELIPNLDVKISNELHWADIYRNVSFMGNKNCLVLNGTIFERKSIPSACTDLYRGVCTYNMGYQAQQQHPLQGFTDYCKTRYNMSCVSNDLGSSKSCYCRIEAREANLPRTAFCNRLVDITDPYPNNLLTTILGEHKSCWIGLEKEGASYKWTNINKTSEYTFWSNTTDFNNPYGALGTNGWLLEEDGTLNCAICEIIPEDYPQVDLQIEYNKTTNTLHVQISNPMGAFESVTCFAQNSGYYNTIDLRYIKNNSIAEKLEFDFTMSGYYWCKALQLPDLTPIYSNTIFIPSKYGHEYSVILVTLPKKGNSPHEYDTQYVCTDLLYFFPNVEFRQKLVKILNQREEDTVKVLCHFNAKSSESSISEQFAAMSDSLSYSIGPIKITNFTSMEVCLPSVTISGNQTLHWPETPIGATTIPEELCLQSGGSPVTRTCTGEFYYGSQWLEVNGTCADVVYSHTTQVLNNLLESNITAPNNLTKTILDITSSKTLTSFEIHLVSKVLDKLTTFKEFVNLGDITKIVNNVMNFEPNALDVAQESLNSTDMILYNLDEIIARTKLDADGYTSEITENLVIQINDLKKTKINGIKLEKTQNGFDPTKINPLQQGTDLTKENFELALFIPQELHKEITNCIGEISTPNLITTVFYDDVLFNEQNHTNQPDGRIIGVTIPNFNCTFSTPLQVIFNPSTTNNTRLKCASWVYGFNDLKESTHGRWLIEDSPKLFGDTIYQVCEFTHITHFTLLILGGADEISGGHKKALDIITAVGCGLSIFGLLMVFLTAIKFKSFRSANAVVINFSVAMTAQIVLLFVADNITGNNILCAVFGAILHYIVLVQFSWMLTIAILQYKRYVVVFSNPSPYLVVKSCACSWGIPLIPIIIMISISRESYGENSHGLCYALGNYFIFGVLIPVSLIIFINLMVFLRIMLSIASSRKIKVHQKKDETSSLQLRLAVLLYFLLGLTWGFGLLAAIGGGVVYSYLFCITATLQGFILFLYFIVLNEKTRSLWTNMKTCNCTGKSDEYEVNTDSAATAMMRRPGNTTSSNTNTSSTTSDMLRKFKNRSSSDF